MRRRRTGEELPPEQKDLSARLERAWKEAARFRKRVKKGHEPELVVKPVYSEPHPRRPRRRTPPAED